MTSTERSHYQAEIAKRDVEVARLRRRIERIPLLVAQFIDVCYVGRDDDPHTVAGDIEADIRCGAWLRHIRDNRDDYDLSHAGDAAIVDEAAP